MKTTMNQSIKVGVGIGKYRFDIYIRLLDIYFTVSNGEKGIKEAVKHISKYKIECIAIEAMVRLVMPFIIAWPKRIYRL